MDWLESTIGYSVRYPLEHFVAPLGKSCKSIAFEHSFQPDVEILETIAENQNLAFGSGLSLLWNDLSELLTWVNSVPEIVHEKPLLPVRFSAIVSKAEQGGRGFGESSQWAILWKDNLIPYTPKQNLLGFDLVNSDLESSTVRFTFPQELAKVNVNEFQLFGTLDDARLAQLVLIGDTGKYWTIYCIQNCDKC